MEGKILLHSWKEISSYLDCSVRTCHRWEEELDLPVHRLDGTPKARVFAYPDELDRWLEEKLGTSGDRAKKRPILAGDLKRWVWLLPAVILAASVVSIPRFLSPVLLPIPEDKPTLAVVTFGTAGPDEKLEAWRTVLPDLLIADLDQSRFVTVAPITQTYRKLRELKMAETGEFSAEDLRRVAGAANVRYVATGSLGTSGPRVTVSVVVHDVTTGKAAEPCVASFRDDTGVFTATDTLSRKVKEALGLETRYLARDIDEKVAAVSTGSKQAFQLYSQGYRLAGIGKYQESLAVLQRAVDADPNFALAYKTLYGCAVRLTRREEARGYLEKALDLASRLSERERGQTRVQFYENYDRASPRMMESLERLCRFYPDDWLGSQRLAPIYVDQEKWDEVRELSERSWRVNKNDVRVTFNLPTALLMAYENLDQGDRAGRFLDEYLNDPAVSYPQPARSYRWGFLVRQGRFAEALAELDKQAANLPNRRGLSQQYGTVHLYRDDFESAEREFRKGLDKDIPSFGPVGALGALSDVSLAKGKVDEAIERMRRRLALVEEDDSAKDPFRPLPPPAVRAAVEVDCRIQLARLYRISGRLPEASREIEAARRLVGAVDIDKLSSIIFLDVSHLSALIAQDTGLESEFEKRAEEIKRYVARQRNPRLLRTYYHLLGYRELQRNQLERAIKFFGKAVDLMSVPGNVGLFQDLADPQLLYSLADAYDRYHGSIRALPLFEKLTTPIFSRFWSRGDLYAKSFYRLAEIHDRAVEGQSSTAETIRESRMKAVEYYRKFLSLWGDADPVFAAEVENARARLAYLTSR